MTTTDGLTIAAPLPLAPAERRRSATSWRSILLGLLGTILICALTPYNDYALNNTFVIGNNLPLGVVMLAFAFALLGNGPLSRWWPDLAFTSGEMTVAFSMTLVSCALPSSGLMRYFPPSLVGPYWLARSSNDYYSLLDAFNLPPLAVSLIRRQDRCPAAQRPDRHRIPGTVDRRPTSHPLPRLADGLPSRGGSSSWRCSGRCCAWWPWFAGSGSIMSGFRSRWRRSNWFWSSSPGAGGFSTTC